MRSGDIRSVELLGIAVGFVVLVLGFFPNQPDRAVLALCTVIAIILIWKHLKDEYL